MKIIIPHNDSPHIVAGATRLHYIAMCSKSIKRNNKNIIIGSSNPNITLCKMCCEIEKILSKATFILSKQAMYNVSHFDHNYIVSDNRNNFIGPVEKFNKVFRRRWSKLEKIIRSTK